MLPLLCVGLRDQNIFAVRTHIGAPSLCGVNPPTWERTRKIFSCEKNCSLSSEMCTSIELAVPIMVVEDLALEEVGVKNNLVMVVEIGFLVVAAVATESG